MVMFMLQEQLLHSMMSVFTFMGANILRQDDGYSFHVIERILETVFPTIMKVREVEASSPSCYSISLQWFSFLQAVWAEDLHVWTVCSNKCYLIHPVTQNKYSICTEAEAVMLKSKFINAVFYDIYVSWNLPTYLGIVYCIIYNLSICTYTHLFTHLSYTFTFINFSSIHCTHPCPPSVSFHSLLQGVGFWVCCLCVWPAHSCASFLNKITCIEAGVWFGHHLCAGVSKGRGPQWGGHGDHGASGLCRRLPAHPWAPKADDLHHAAACGRNWALHVAPPAGLHRGCGSANKDQHCWASNRKGKGMWGVGPWVLFCFFLCLFLFLWGLGE